MQRVKQAVAEIRKVARTNPMLGAEGAVLFLEQVSPALEHVDGSSGAIGSAVNGAIAELVPIIATAPCGREDARCLARSAMGSARGGRHAVHRGARRSLG
ncbi:MAG: hypothetical protein JO121_11565 [Deltaproteobacteria bacterium]|nr:hypothetical protein [Deltaproteobacteria bacterium]